MSVYVAMYIMLIESKLAMVTLLLYLLCAIYNILYVYIYIMSLEMYRNKFISDPLVIDIDKNPIPLSGTYYF